MPNIGNCICNCIDDQYLGSILHFKFRYTRVWISRPLNSLQGMLIEMQFVKYFRIKLWSSYYMNAQKVIVLYSMVTNMRQNCVQWLPKHVCLRLNSQGLCSCQLLLFLLCRSKFNSISLFHIIVTFFPKLQQYTLWPWKPDFQFMTPNKQATMSA